MTTHHETNPTSPCAGEGVGYWECDTPGGCTDCRELAISLNDYTQFDTWAEDLDALVDVYAKKAELRRLTSACLALVVGG